MGGEMFVFQKMPRLLKFWYSFCLLYSFRLLYSFYWLYSLYWLCLVSKWVISTIISCYSPCRTHGYKNMTLLLTGGGRILKMSGHKHGLFKIEVKSQKEKSSFMMKARKVYTWPRPQSMNKYTWLRKYTAFNSLKFLSILSCTLIDQIFILIWLFSFFNIREKPYYNFVSPRKKTNII